MIKQLVNFDICSPDGHIKLIFDALTEDKQSSEWTAKPQTFKVKVTILLFNLFNDTFYSCIKMILISLMVNWMILCLHYVSYQFLDHLMTSQCYTTPYLWRVWLNPSNVI